MRRAAKSQMRQRRACLFLVLEEPLSMRQLRHPLTSPPILNRIRSTFRARSPACALAMDESSSRDLVSRASSPPCSGVAEVWISRLKFAVIAGKLRAPTVMTVPRWDLMEVTTVAQLD